MSTTAPIQFYLPSELCAQSPPERRGIARDKVRLMIIDRNSGGVEHKRFDRLGDSLRAGDLLVFNSSRTLPACLDGCCQPGPCLEVRLAERLPDEDWLALIACKQGDTFSCGIKAGLKIDFGLGLQATIIDRDEKIPRLWRIAFSKSGAQLIDLIYRLGHPVRYEYTAAPWPLDYYQTVYARVPGSAEMPSAGRAFTWQMLFDLRRRGIDTTEIVLHTGLSSYLDDNLDALHPASEEEYEIGKEAAEKINRAHDRGNRVIAIGTTVVRALESVADNEGRIISSHGYTRLRITVNHHLKAVDGLLTGLHEPTASHLDLLSAFLSPQHLHHAYQQAIALKYLWHEFGDLNLIL